MLPRILIVEDDRYLQRLLHTHLELDYKIDITPSVDEAYQLIDQHHFDLALVDRVLVDGDGLEVIGYLKDISPKTKVIALSRMGKPDQRVNGLEQGADDYLAKPIYLAELKIKIKQQLSSKQVKYHSTQRQMNTNKLSLNLNTAELKLGSKSMVLRKKEMQILATLLERKDQVTTRQMILDQVWQDPGFKPNKTTLDVYIRRLRMHLGNQAGQIETIKGIGYRYVELT